MGNLKKTLPKIALPFALLLLILQAASGQEPNKPATAPLSQQKPASVFTLPKGTLIEVQIDTSVSSRYAQVGHFIALTVAQPVKIDGVTVFKKGAHARGRVIKAHKAGRWGRAGEIVWVIEDVIAEDGTRVALQFAHQEKIVGEAERAPTAIRTVAGVAAAATLGPIGLPIGAFLVVKGGLAKGQDVTIPAGILLETTVKADVKLSLPREDPAREKTEPPKKIIKEITTKTLN